ncbi:hypothetical protein LOC71_20785 [Rhodopirellula sp. JC740]|uniref:Transmembrane protein n=1 Tax=Rhodopirellula halodulae TaxID=2894198 RepID=A0ABS8NMF4_9BACT|nr:hypothetical protein [Rhodopirellula sp. JC740]MCC9644717.1 hypothetical protein [Rhodopirellula sp. JC740]
MTQSVQCPRCMAAVAVSDDAGGTRVLCPKCEETFLVPGISASSTNDDDDWLELSDPPPRPKPTTTVGSSPAATPKPAASTPATTPKPAATSPPVQAKSQPVSDESASEDSSLGDLGALLNNSSGSSSSSTADEDDMFGGLDLPPMDVGDDDGSDPFELQDLSDAIQNASQGKPSAAAAASSSDPFDDPDDPFNLDAMEETSAFPGSQSSASGDPTVDPLFEKANSYANKASGARASASDEPVAHNVEYETNYRVRCPVCSTVINVTANKAGKQVRCHDCHKMVKVPPPPKKKKKVVIDMDRAESFQFNESAVTQKDRPADPFRRSAEELLAEAAKVEEESPAADYDVPKITDWAKGVFGIFFQFGVVVHWLILSAIASTLAGLVLASGYAAGLMFLFPAGVFYGAMVLACGFVILQSVSNDEESVSDWPLTLEPLEWMAPTIFCFAAVGLTGGPGWLLGHMAFGENLATVCLIMLSIFLLFPFVLLSMLDMQNIFVPFSPEVGRSVTRCEEAWGGFYLSSALVFFGVFMVFAAASLVPPIGAAVICIFTATAATFIYFGMLGRLAKAIGQSVNEKPRPNDIDEVREAERARQSGQ